METTQHLTLIKGQQRDTTQRPPMNVKKCTRGSSPGKQRPPGGCRPDFSAAPSKIAFPSPRGGRKRPCCLLQGPAPTQKNGRGPAPWGGARPGGAQQLQIWATIVQTPSPRGGSKGAHRFGLVGTAHLVPVCTRLLTGRRPGGVAFYICSIPIGVDGVYFNVRHVSTLVVWYGHRSS